MNNIEFEESEQKPGDDDKDKFIKDAAKPAEGSQGLTQILNSRISNEKNRPNNPNKDDLQNDLLAKQYWTTHPPTMPISDKAVSNAQKILDSRMDNEKLNLKPEQLAAVKAIEKAILSGDIAGLQQIMKDGKYSNDPNIKSTVAQDLKLLNIKFDINPILLNMHSEAQGDYPYYSLSVRPEAGVEPRSLLMLGERLSKLLPNEIPGSYANPDAVAREIAFTAMARAAILQKAKTK